MGFRIVAAIRVQHEVLHHRELGGNKGVGRVRRCKRDEGQDWHASRYLRACHETLPRSGRKTLASDAFAGVLRVSSVVPGHHCSSQGHCKVYNCRSWTTNRSPAFSAKLRSYWKLMAPSSADTAAMRKPPN